MHGVPRTVMRDFLTQTMLSRDLPGRLSCLMIAVPGEPAHSSGGRTSDLLVDGHVSQAHVRLCSGTCWNLLEKRSISKVAVTECMGLLAATISR